jgi:hypothetical protein
MKNASEKTELQPETNTLAADIMELVMICVRNDANFDCHAPLYSRALKFARGLMDAGKNPVAS